MRCLRIIRQGFDRIGGRGVNDASSDLESAVASPALLLNR